MPMSLTDWKSIVRFAVHVLFEYVDVHHVTGRSTSKPFVFYITYIELIGCTDQIDDCGPIIVYDQYLESWVPYEKTEWHVCIFYILSPPRW